MTLDCLVRRTVGIGSNEEIRNPGLNPPEQDGRLTELEEEDEISRSQLRERIRNKERSEVEQDLPLKKRLRGGRNLNLNKKYGCERRDGRVRCLCAMTLGSFKSLFVV